MKIISLFFNRKLWIYLLLSFYSIACTYSNQKSSEWNQKLNLALQPPEIITHPSKKYFDENRNYNMVIGTDQSPSGRIWAAWVSGEDGPGAYFVVASSDDSGLTWSKPRLVIDPLDHPSGLARRTLVGNLWTDPKGRLWLFFDQSMGFFDGRAGSWYIRSNNPDAENPQWTKPKRIWHGCTLQKPVVLSSGEWLLPISLWDSSWINLWEVKQSSSSEKYFSELDKDRKAWVFISKDEGDTWEKQGSIKFPNFNFDEHIMVELNDGRLWMTARTKNGMYETYSSDKGKTWAKPFPSTIVNTNSRHFMRRLNSGNILLVKNGPINKDVGRKQLMAFISTDEGKTWKGGLELETIDRDCSYPDGFQNSDDQIFIIYDHERSGAKEILMARFTEKDIISKKIIDSNSRLKLLVSKAGN